MRSLILLASYVAIASTVFSDSRIDFYKHANAVEPIAYCAYKYDQCYRLPEGLGISSFKHQDRDTQGKGRSITLFRSKSCNDGFQRWSIKAKFANTEQADYMISWLNDSVHSFMIKNEVVGSGTGMSNDQHSWKHANCAYQ